MKSIENEIRQHWGQRGYWKQRIAMRISYSNHNLKQAWTVVNWIIEKINTEIKAKHVNDSMTESEWCKGMIQVLDLMAARGVKMGD
jgi:hypothetical protein